MKKAISVFVPPLMMIVFWAIFTLFGGQYPTIIHSLCIQYYLFSGLLIPSLSAFFVNLYFPHIKNLKLGLLYGIPTLITCYIIFAILPSGFVYTDPTRDCADIAGCMMEDAFSFVLFVPLSFISCVGVALSGLLGTRKSKVNIAS